MSVANTLLRDRAQARATAANIFRDPGDGGTIQVNADDGFCPLTIGTGAETRVLPAAAGFGVGTKVLVQPDSIGSGGSCTVSGQSFTTMGEKCLFAVTSSSGTKAWVAQSGYYTRMMKRFPVALTSLRTPADLAVLLPATPDTQILGLVTGTYLTDAPHLLGNDYGGTTDADAATFLWQVPASYVAAGAITAYVTGHMQVVADLSAAVSVEAVRVAAPTVEIGAITDREINSLTSVTVSQSLTATNVVATDVLRFRVTGTVTDFGNAAANINEIITGIEIRALCYV